MDQIDSDSIEIVFQTPKATSQIIKRRQFVCTCIVLDKKTGEPIQGRRFPLQFFLQGKTNKDDLNSLLKHNISSGYADQITSKNGELFSKLTITQVSSKNDPDGYVLGVKVLGKEKIFHSQCFKVISKPPKMVMVNENKLLKKRIFELEEELGAQKKAKNGDP